MLMYRIENTINSNRLTSLETELLTLMFPLPVRLVLRGGTRPNTIGFLVPSSCFPPNREGDGLCDSRGVEVSDVLPVALAAEMAGDDVRDTGERLRVGVLLGESDTKVST